MDHLVNPIKEKLLAVKKAQTKTSPAESLKPLAEWNFNGNLEDEMGNFHLKAHGKVSFEEGAIVLKKSYLQSAPIPFDIKAKSLEVWFKIHDLNQKGGGAMTIQGQGDFFDSIVYGERKNQHWISGSNGHSRTQDFKLSKPERSKDIINLIMVYEKNGTTTLYRNGELYGQPYKKKAAIFPKNKASLLFGLRHLPAGGNKFLNMTLHKARFYNRALSRQEVKAAYKNSHFVSETEIVKALSANNKKRRIQLLQELKKTEAQLKRTPVLDKKGLIADRRQRQDNSYKSAMRSQTFNKVPVSDLRYGGIITNAAVLTMTSAPKRTQPITRGAWMIEVVFNDPPPPPPNDVPPLDEENLNKNLTIKESFAEHRKNPDCAGCHSRLDPFGFALENYDVVGLWRDKYRNRRKVDPSGKMMKKYQFDNSIDFKKAIVKEKKRFAKAFTGHLMRFALGRKLTAKEYISVEQIVQSTEPKKYAIKALIKELVLSPSFHGLDKLLSQK